MIPVTALSLLVSLLIGLVASCPVWSAPPAVPVPVAALGIGLLRSEQGYEERLQALPEGFSLAPPARLLLFSAGGLEFFFHLLDGNGLDFNILELGQSLALDPLGRLAFSGPVIGCLR